MNKNYKDRKLSLATGCHDEISPTSKIQEYVQKFGGAERFFNKILDSLEFPFNIINVETLTVEISNMKGFRPGVKCYELCYGKDKKCDECIIDKVLERKKQTSIDKDGFDIFMTPIFGERERIISVIKYWVRRREVVKERIFGGTSQKQEENFYDILQNSNDIVYKYDFVMGGFEYVSESVYTLMGFPLIEFIKMRYEDFLARIHPEDIRGVCKVDADNGKTICHEEYRWRCKNEKYRWFSDNKTWFFDENGKRLCVFGNIKDIEREKEKEKEIRDLKERIALIKRKESEASERIILTDKEKLVLWGFCRFPLLNDEELSTKLKLKRSTLTAIKNRLKSKGWFDLKYIPNFTKLDCQIIGIFEGGSRGKTWKLDFDSIKKTSEIVLTNYQDEKFFGVFVSDKYVRFRKFLEEFEDNNKASLERRFKENSFFCDLEEFEMQDLSGIVNSLFELGRKEEPVFYNFKGKPEELNINEKRVLHSMIKDPDLSSAEIAKKIWVSKPTVIKIRNKLLDGGFVYAMVVPDFRKMGLGCFGRFCYEFDSELSDDIKKKKDVGRMIMKITGKRKLVKFILFSSNDEYAQEVDFERESHRRGGDYFKLDSEFFMMQKRGRSNFDFEPLINNLLFGNEA